MKSFALAVLLSLAAGCASPDYRINKNLDLFNSFPESAREKIRTGQIEVGFTPDMVEMALGKPGRIVQRKAEDMAEEVWIYYMQQPRTTFVNPVMPYYYGGANCSHGKRRSYYPLHYPMHVTEYYSVETGRVIFGAGKVKTFEYTDLKK